MRVLIVTTELSLGRGIGRYIVGLVTNMVRQREDVEFLIMSRQSWPVELRHQRIRQVEPALNPVTRRTKGDLLWYHWTSVATMRRHQAHLMHGVSNFGSALTSKQVITVHDAIPLCRWEYNWTQPTGALARQYRMQRHAYRRTGAIAAVSKFTADEIDHCLSRHAPITVTHNGVEREYFKDLPNAEHIRITVDKRLSEPYILYTGGVDRRKNIEGAANAYLRTSQDFRSRFRFCILGDLASLTDELKSLMFNPEHAERFIHQSFVEYEALRAIYKGASLVVYPSFYEGFGIPPLEAMASRVPVVTSTRASIPEVCGDHAIFIEPDDIQALALAIESSATSRDEARIEAAFQHARTFTWERTAELTYGVYQQVLGGSR